jgi:AcrR family transcriptional regulator
MADCGADRVVLLANALVGAALQNSQSAIEVGDGRAITRRALYNRVWAKPMSVVAEDLKLSPNGLAKICDRLLIPYPGRGFWKGSGALHVRPPLPPPPAGGATRVLLTGQRAKSRRLRTRLSPEARREQLIEVAGLVVAREGLAAATMKRVAREAGVSEAQAHNYFSRRDDLLVALARRELTAMEANRLSEAQRAADNHTRVTLSTISYLRQVNDRGALIQTLLNSPAVRAGLRFERQARESSAREETAERMNTRYGVPRDFAYGATVILTAVCLRAGRLLAEHKIPLEMAERLSLALVTAGNRRIAKRRAAA